MIHWDVHVGYSGSRCCAHNFEQRAVGIMGFRNIAMEPFGARSFRALYVSRSTLKSILLLTGSQCREASTGEMCSYVLVLVSVRAAAFCISCRLFIELMLHPDRRAYI